MTLLDGREPEAGDLRALALTNYGHFTTFRVEEGRVRGLSLHLERLDRDCRALFGVPADLDAVRAWVRQEAGAHDPVTVRVTVFDPGLDIGHPALANRPRVLVTRRAPVAPAAAPGPMRVRCVPYERDAPEVKSVGLFGPLRLRREAQLAGFDDALFVDRAGLISEGGTWNVGFVTGDGEVVWPRAACLDGVTMRLLRAAGGHRSTPVPRAELGAMVAAFATNAATGVRALAGIDDRTLDAAHPAIGVLAAAYRAVPSEPL